MDPLAELVENSIRNRSASDNTSTTSSRAALKALARRHGHDFPSNPRRRSNSTPRRNKLLSYVSGLNAAVATAIVARRNEKGRLPVARPISRTCRASGRRHLNRPPAFLPHPRRRAFRSTPVSVHPERYGSRRKDGRRLRRDRRRLDPRRKNSARKSNWRITSPPTSASPPSPTLWPSSRSPAAIRASSSRRSVYYRGASTKTRGFEAGHEAARQS